MVGRNDWNGLDKIQAQQSELGSHVIDELLSGNLNRREFMRRGAVIGLGSATLGAVLAACGGANSRSSSAGASTASPRKGGTLRVAATAPNTAPNPLLVSDVGGAAMLTQTGEYLIHDDPTYTLRPMLATSWSPNSAGDVWTIKLRPNVRFHNGKGLTAKDVVYTYDLNTNPKNASAALSALQGVLSHGQTEAADDHTVIFHLDAPVGNFPYLISSDTYNTIILPDGTDPSEWGKTFVGTGPFKLRSYSANVGAKFVRNPDYWGTKVLLDGTAFNFYDGPQPQLLALQSNTVDVIQQVAAQGSAAILHNPAYTILDHHCSAYREVHMRTDMAPFTDKRVRQALALTLARPQIVSALFQGRATLGNDSPFAPVFKSTNTSVPQRTKDIAKARQLLRAAGVPHGFNVTLTTETLGEIPQYAQIIQQSAKQVGININLKVETEAAYYGKAVIGQSDWLDSVLGITDYGARGAPNVFLQATLTSHGIWNAARFNNANYNGLVKKYVAAVDLQSQRKAAGKIQEFLLDETPLIIGYFFDWLTPTKNTVKGVVPGAEGQMFLGGASIA